MESSFVSWDDFWVNLKADARKHRLVFAAGDLSARKSLIDGADSMSICVFIRLLISGYGMIYIIRERGFCRGWIWGERITLFYTARPLSTWGSPFIRWLSSCFCLQKPARRRWPLLWRSSALYFAYWAAPFCRWLPAGSRFGLCWLVLNWYRWYC